MNKDDELLKFYYDTLHLGFNGLEQAFFFFYNDKLNDEERIGFVKTQDDLDEEIEKENEEYRRIYENFPKKLRSKMGLRVVFTLEGKIHQNREYIIETHLKLNDKLYEKFKVSYHQIPQSKIDRFKNKVYRDLIYDFDDIIGPILMKECNETESCPMKALLPENKVTEIDKVNKT